MKRALLTAAALSFLATPAQAYIYPLAINVGSEREIWELFYNEDIDDLDRDRLLELWDRGVPVNSAEYADFYALPGVTRAMARKLLIVRKNRSGYSSVEDLAAVLPRDVYAQAEPFLRFDGSFDLLRKLEITSEVRVLAVTADASDRFSDSVREDPDVRREPSEVGQRASAAIRADVASGKKWRAGVALTSHELVADYAAAGQGAPMVSPGVERTYDLAHAYVSGGGDDWKFVLGSYSLGFGLGLIFDDSGRGRPNGFFHNNAVTASDSGGLSLHEREVGLAVRGRYREAGPGWITGHVFLSRARRDLFQYEFQPNAAVLDRVDEEGEAVKLSSATFKDAYVETLAGADVSFSMSKTRVVGVTGWSAETDFSELPGVVFGQGAKFPPAGAYRAAGAHLSWDFAGVDLGAEAAFTQAQCDERKLAWQGSPAGLCVDGARMTGVGAVGVVEVEPLSTLDVRLDGWYYGPQFLNPHSSAPQASAQERLGNRNRNQTGARLRGVYKPNSDLLLRAEAAVWKALEPHVDTAFLPEEVSALPSGVSTPGCSRTAKDGAVKELDPVCEDPTDMKVALRSTAKVSDREKVMVGMDFADESIADTGRLQDFSDEHGGSRVRLHARLTTERIPRTKLAVGLMHAWVDRLMRGCAAPDPADPLKCARADLIGLEEFDTDLTASLVARIDTTPGPKIVLSARLRDYGRQESFDGNGNFKTGDQRDETSVALSASFKQKLGKRASLGLRMTMDKLLDDRPNAPGATTTTQNRQDLDRSAKLVFDTKF